MRAIVKYVIFLFWILYLSGLVRAQNYLWPTNASQHLTSSFCEYRPGHYHSAIDIKTWGQVGYPIYAIDDGIISRIRVSPFGYGKVIYIRLNDGRYAVYAHLKKFPQVIEKALRQEQIRRERYTITWKPEHWPVKKGQIIGYTGETGIGVPHLHFEIRDANHRPLNPLKFYDVVEDNISPVIRSLMVIPLHADSRVNGTFKPQRFALFKSKNGVFRVKGKIKVNGPVGLAIRGYDQADGVYNKFAFYETLLHVNQKPKYHIRYDRLNFDDTRLIDIEIHYPTRIHTRQVYHKLYIEKHNILDFFDRSLGDGIIQASGKNIPIEITVRDFDGNTSELKTTLIANGVKPARTKLITAYKNHIYAKLELPDSLKSLQFFSSTSGKKWSPIDHFELIDRQFFGNRQNMIAKIPAVSKTHDYLRTTLETDKGESISTVTALTGNPHPHIMFNLTNMGKYLLLQFDGISDRPDLNLQLQTEQKTWQIKPYIYNQGFEYVLRPHNISTGPFRIKLHTTSNNLVDTSFAVYRFTPGQADTLQLFDEHLLCLSNRKSLYDTLFIQAQKQLPQTKEETELLSAAYQLTPRDRILRNGISVGLKYDAGSYRHSQIGLYKMDENNKLHMASRSIDSTRSLAWGKTRNLGTFVVATDTVKPVLEIKRPYAGQVLTQLKSIRFYAVDELSGIGSDQNIDIRINGKFIIPEWDPEKDIITGRPHFDLQSGDHQIVIRVKDRAGNQNKKSFTIRIAE
ncbi:MAG: peptidoglycan DD-metalloendopeptidase family protein [Caldithrix sp.]|nr:peptidoglycan DD-metalloendopeptidase family protein [Caldithrix sp.]